MAAKDNINRGQFVKVFRGFDKKSPDDIDYDKLGMHWSSNIHVARDFTRDRGTIIEGKVDKSQLMTPEHPDWREFRLKHLIFGPNSKEREITVLPGSPVKISQAHHVLGEEEEDIYTYKSGTEYDELVKRIPKQGTA